MVPNIHEYYTKCVAYLWGEIFITINYNGSLATSTYYSIQH